MFGHIDVLRTSSWQAQFRGVRCSFCCFDSTLCSRLCLHWMCFPQAKRWFICAPDQKQYLYHAGDVDAWNWDPEK